MCSRGEAVLRPGGRSLGAHLLCMLWLLLLRDGEVALWGKGEAEGCHGDHPTAGPCLCLLLLLLLLLLRSLLRAGKGEAWDEGRPPRGDGG